MIAAVAVLAYVFVGRPGDIDAKAQESAATAYMKNVERLTHGGIQLDTSAVAPIGDHSQGAIIVTLVVGGCNDVTGYIDSPKRPKSKSDLGDLRIEVPGSNRYAAYAYPVIHVGWADWRKPLTRGDSGLSHCLSDK